MPLFMCHSPAGVSIKQLLHYSQAAQFGNFGKFIDTNKIPPDFRLSKITVPINIHYSSTDTLTHPIDVEKLLTKLRNAEVTVQKIIGINFNHFDFIVSVNSASIIYSEILKFFNTYQ